MTFDSGDYVTTISIVENLVRKIAVITIHYISLHSVLLNKASFEITYTTSTMNERVMLQEDLFVYFW